MSIYPPVHVHINDTVQRQGMIRCSYAWHPHTKAFSLLGHSSIFQKLVCRVSYRLLR